MANGAGILCGGDCDVIILAMKKIRLDIIMYVLSGLLLVAGVALVIRQYVLIPGDYTPPPVQTPAPTAEPTPLPAASATAVLEPTPTIEPTPTPYVYDRVAPIRLYFLDAEVMVDVLPVGIVEEGKKKGQMDTIEDPDLAGWYEDGPAPGELGNAIIAGHKSLKGKIGRFTVLYELEIGQVVAVERDDGSVRYFAVESVDFYPYDDYPDSVMRLDSDDSRLTLITCYGKFDRNVGTSEQRCVAVCTLIEDYDQGNGVL